MTDDRATLEVRLHDAFRREPLPPAPDSLIRALDEVAPRSAAAAEVAPRARGRAAWTVFGIAALLILGTAYQLVGSGGGRPPAPPSVRPVDPVRLAWGFRDGTPSDAAVVDRTLEIIRDRLAGIGITEADVQLDGDEIAVEFPDNDIANSALDTVATPGRVTFVPIPEGHPLPVVPGTTPALNQYAPLFDSAEIADASIVTDQNGKPALSLKLSPRGTALFAEYTRSHIGSTVAIVLDRVAVLVPTVMEPVRDGEVQIGSGIDGPDEASLRRLATIIALGPLPVELLPVSVPAASSAPSASG